MEDLLKNDTIQEAIDTEMRKAKQQLIAKIQKAGGFVIKDDETKTPVRGLAWSAKVAPTPDGTQNKIRGFGRVENIEVITKNLSIVHATQDEDDMSPNNHCLKNNHKDCTLVFIS